MYTLDQKNTHNLFLFYCGLYVLIFICFLGGYLSSVSFLLTFEINHIGSVLGKALCLIFISVYLINPNSGKLIYQSLTNTIYLEKVLFFTKKLNVFIQKHPFFSFYMVYIYVILLFLHWFMLLYTDIDIYVEFFYNCFNLIRLLVFPLVIYYYILYYGPTSFAMIDFSITKDEMLKALKSTANLIKSAHSMAPKTTKATAAIIAVTGVGVGAASSHATGVRNYVNNSASSPNMARQLDHLHSQACMSDDECLNAIQEIVRITLGINKTNMGLTYDDLMSFIKKDPTLTDAWGAISMEIPKLNANALKIARSKAEAISMAKAEAFTKAEASFQGKTASALQESPTSMITSTKPSNPSSPLEDILWLF